MIIQGGDKTGNYLKVEILSAVSPNTEFLFVIFLFIEMCII